MASAVDVHTFGSAEVALFRLGMFGMTVGCAVLLFFHEALWGAAVAAFAGAAVWTTSGAHGNVHLRLREADRCEIFGPVQNAEAQLDSVFSGWGFAVLHLRAAGQRHVFVATWAHLAGSEAGRFRRWLNLSALT